jgi:hypothetical protein
MGVRPSGSETSVISRVTVADTAVLQLDPGTSEVIRIARPARTVLVGSPDVIEASAINENTIALTAKADGLTNLILLDENGVEFFRRAVRVGEPPAPPPPPPKPIVVYSGTTVNQYVCAPICNLPPEIGAQTSNLLPVVAYPSSGAFPNCDAARAVGAAPLRRGQPGYGPHLDRDNDGVACEPLPVR